MTEKEKLLKYIEEFDMKTATKDRNAMGCSELWYDPYYGVMNSFTIDEIKEMDEKEIEHLLKIATTVSEGLY